MKVPNNHVFNHRNQCMLKSKIDKRKYKMLQIEISIINKKNQDKLCMYQKYEQTKLFCEKFKMNK